MRRVRNPAIDVDRLQAGAGPKVILVHSSVAGARQWRRLMNDLEDRFHVLAINLLGYGQTPAWTGQRAQTLDDQAILVETVLTEGDDDICLVGHSFGGSVAMKAAQNLGERVDKLVLLEPNPFFLLDQHGRTEAFADVIDLCNLVKGQSAFSDWTAAAMKFADYWGGAGTWTSIPDERRRSFIEGLKTSNVHEWDAVMDEPTTLEAWTNALPDQTMIISSKDPVKPIREIIDLLRKARTSWRFAEYSEGGHMGPLTRPDLVNPMISTFLEGN